MQRNCTVKKTFITGCNVMEAPKNDVVTSKPTTNNSGSISGNTGSNTGSNTGGNTGGNDGGNGGGNGDGETEFN